MNELALFAGSGGGILGGRLLGWRTVCAVELEPYPQRILGERQNDGTFEPFPIYNDIRHFDGVQWEGVVDVVSGGFPCQPYSTASRGRANAECLWHQMFRVVEEVSPDFVFAENVQRGPLEDAAAELEGMLGYRPAVACVSAADLGAPHRRDRWWLLAHADGKGERLRAIHGEMARLPRIAKALWPEPGSEVLGDDARLPDRMAQLKAIGNGQVPAVAARAFEILAGRLAER